MPGDDFSCPGGTVCCENLNRCDYAGCSGIPSIVAKGPYSSPHAGSCDGTPDDTIVCLSSNTFNVCVNNG